MNLLLKKKSVKQSLRHIVVDDRSLRKAAKASIRDQKKITIEAGKLRSQLAN